MAMQSVLSLQITPRLYSISAFAHSPLPSQHIINYSPLGSAQRCAIETAAILNQSPHSRYGWPDERDDPLLHPGRRPDVPIIAIYIRKSIHMLLAVFGVVEAGAAFTSLDPENARDRNDFITQDIDATLAITDNPGRCASLVCRGHV